MSDIDASFRIEQLLENFEKAISFLKGELSSIKAGRANASMLDKVLVDYYGTPTPLKQMANIMTPDANSLTVSLWDISAIDAVRKGILAANLGMNMSDDGKLIRLMLPALTEERRRELAKQIKQLGENSKISLRNERRDALDFCKKQKNEKLLTEDDLAGIEKQVQKLIDEATATVDKIVADKEKDIMTI